MAIDHYQIWQESIEKLSQLRGQRRKLDKAIARLERMINWGPVTTPGKSTSMIADTGEIGFTEGVRKVFSTYRIWLSPVLVRDLLPSIGFSTDPYKDPLPIIHVILRRMASKRELIQRRDASGVTFFFYTGNQGPGKTIERVASV